MRIELGTVPWTPSEGASLKDSWHFWDHPRWGYFEQAHDGARIAFHRHESVGDFNDGPSLWTYRPLDAESLSALSLPPDQWGESWQRAYEKWRAATPAEWWCIADDALLVVRFGQLVPAAIDDDAWAANMARLERID